jgi:hypothetical protein
MLKLMFGIGHVKYTTQSTLGHKFNAAIGDGLGECEVDWTELMTRE